MSIEDTTYFISKKWQNYFVMSVGIILIAISALVLVGWVFDITFLKSLSPKFASMKINTAVAFCLCGLSLLLLHWSSSVYTRIIIYACAVMIFLIGFISLNEYLFDMNFNIDQLIYSEGVPSKVDPALVRMSCITAFNFITLAVVYICILNKKVKPWVYQLMILIVFFNSLFILIGYWYGVKIIYRNPYFLNAVALHTAFLFLLLSVALLLRQSQCGFTRIFNEDNLGGLTFRRILPYVFLIPMILGDIGIISQTKGYYGPDVSIAIIVIGSIIIFTLVTWKVSLLLEAESKKRAESEDKYNLALKSAQVGTWDWRLDKDVMTWTDEIYDLLGVTREMYDNTYLGFLSFVHLDDREAVDTAARKAINGTGECEVEYRVIHPDRRVHYIKAKGKVYRDSSGEAYRMIGVCWEISAQKAAERALKYAKEKAEEASRIKSKFLTSMNHELRTPLNPIIGFSGTLLMRYPGPLTPEQEKQVMIIQRSAKHLLSLIDNILQIAKIESEKTDLMMEDFSCDEVIGAIIEKFKEEAATKNINLIADFRDKKLCIKTDKSAFIEIMTNLVSNAIKYTEYGGVRIVTNEYFENGKEIVSISVIDTGIGIKKEVQKNIFNVLDCDDASRQIVGSGLGLYLSKSLAELLGGDILLESDLREGSNFTLVLMKNACAKEAEL
ncbi:MAG: PAS domain-containing sensor histidine kinase [Gammaproteobacteria bacterium]|nr:PAS domain-containing sensor histidine kinase [Gammaproteobacteria bacterium]